MKCGENVIDFYKFTFKLQRLIATDYIWKMVAAAVMLGSGFETLSQVFQLLYFETKQRKDMVDLAVKPGHCYFIFVNHKVLLVLVWTITYKMKITLYSVSSGCR